MAGRSRCCRCYCLFEGGQAPRSTHLHLSQMAAKKMLQVPRPENAGHSGEHKITNYACHGHGG